MAGGTPRFAVGREQLLHGAAGERDRHHAVPGLPGFDERFPGASAATQNGGRGCCVGRGSEVTLAKLWKRPSMVTSSSSSRRRTCSKPFVEARAALVDATAEARELVRQERAREADIEPAAGDGVEHADLARELERMIEDRQHRAGDESGALRARRCGGEEDDRVGAVAAILVKVVLDGTDVAKPSSSQSETRWRHSAK